MMDKTQMFIILTLVVDCFSRSSDKYKFGLVNGKPVPKINATSIMITSTATKAARCVSVIFYRIESTV